MTNFDFDDEDNSGDAEQLREVRRRRFFMYSTKALRVAEAVEKIYINHPAFKTALTAIDRVFQLGGLTATPQGLMLIGEPGTGKSCVMKLFQAYAPRDSLLSPTSASIMVRLQERPSLGRVISNILRRLDYPFTNVHKNAVGLKRDIVITSLREKRYRILLVDEAHHLVISKRSDRSWTEGNDVSEFFREVMDECQMGIVLAGTPTLDKLPEIDKHLRSRVASRVELRDFSEGPDWLTLLATFGQQCKDFDLSNLAALSARGSLLSACKGNLRSFKQLLIECVLIATDADKSVLDVAILALAFERVHGRDSHLDNPFQPGAGS